MDGQRLEREVDTLARIFAMITNIDQNVGRVMSQLEELEIVENTLVIYVNDNGPNTQRYVGPFRGMKSDVYEGGVRSPLWLHWPARLGPASRSERPAAHIDLMPTILEACNVPTPQGVNFDGRSLLPLLTGERVDWPERHIVIQSHRGSQPQRYHHFMIRDDRWKLVNNSGFGRETFPDQPQFRLYDLHNDAGETRDAAAEHPDTVARLKAAYDEWFDEVSSTRPDNYAPPRILLGGAENPVKLTRQDLQDGAWVGDGPPGHWTIEVAAAGQYDVKLLIDPTKDVPETATVWFDEHSATRKISPGADVCLIRNVAVEQGPFEFRAFLTANGAQRPPHQVIITRRSD